MTLINYWTSSAKLVIFERTHNKYGNSGICLAGLFSTSLQLLIGIWRNLTGSKYSSYSTNFVSVVLNRFKDDHHGLWLAEAFSTSLPPLDGIWRNMTRINYSTFSTKFVIFRADPSTKMAALISDRRFRLLRNHWTEIDETWHGVGTQRPLPNVFGPIIQEKWLMELGCLALCLFVSQMPRDQHTWPELRGVEIPGYANP